MSEVKVAGPSLCSMLLIAFIVLKLCNVISWSWWWVMSPLWIPMAIVLVILIIAGIIYAITNS
jgi:hypothetical protein